MSGDVSVRLLQKKDYQFNIFFDESLPPILGDEPPPLGEGLGPSPAHFLAIAVGNCLIDSLRFALVKFKQDADPLEVEVTCGVGRNHQNRLRVVLISVNLKIGVMANRIENLDRILSQFRDFCTVSSSISEAIPIEIKVIDASGDIIFTDKKAP